MKTAEALKLSVAECEIRRECEIPYLLVERYDRQVLDGNVHRLHQEDACQALGLPPSMKYEKDRAEQDPDRAASFANLFALSQRMGTPARFRQSIIEVTFFNWLIGNHDAHSKNFAILYSGRKPELSKFYDLVSIDIYEGFWEMSMRIGGKKMWDQVNAEHWLEFLGSADIPGERGTKVLEKSLKKMAEEILPAMTGIISEAGIKTVLGGGETKALTDVVRERLIHLNKVFGWDISTR